MRSNAGMPTIPRPQTSDNSLAGQYVGPNDMRAHYTLPGYIPRQDWQNASGTTRWQACLDRCKSRRQNNRSPHRVFEPPPRQASGRTPEVRTVGLSLIW
jgi:hypothetical protein